MIKIKWFKKDNQSIINYDEMLKNKQIEIEGYETTKLIVEFTKSTLAMTGPSNGSRYTYDLHMLLINELAKRIDK